MRSVLVHGRLGGTQNGFRTLLQWLRPARYCVWLLFIPLHALVVQLAWRIMRCAEWFSTRPKMFLSLEWTLDFGGLALCSLAVRARLLIQRSAWAARMLFVDVFYHKRVHVLRLRPL